MAQGDEKDKLRASLGNAILVERPNVKVSRTLQISSFPSSVDSRSAIFLLVSKSSLHGHSLHSWDEVGS